MSTWLPSGRPRLMQALVERWATQPGAVFFYTVWNLCMLDRLGSGYIYRAREREIETVIEIVVLHLFLLGRLTSIILLSFKWVKSSPCVIICCFACWIALARNLC